MENQVGQEEMYEEVTKNILVRVTPEYLPDRSDPSNSVYSFVYFVTLENKGEETVQLVNRHWNVISAGKKIADVKGEGVVGVQPVLQPGESFEYNSGTMISDPVGSMLGTYTFLTSSRNFFDVQIPEFHLIFVESDIVH